MELLFLSIGFGQFSYKYPWQSLNGAEGQVVAEAAKYAWAD
jgi:hypothetical protein